jgi:mono/diheme cytochrome c family protein
MTLRSILVVLPLVVLAALWGCDNDTSNDVAGDDPGGPTVTDKTCIGCHGSEDELKAALGDQDVTLKVANKDDG